MAELKTKPTDENVAEYLRTITDEKKIKDSYSLIQLMKEITGEEPKMWGTSIIGFGSYHYKYASGHEGDAALIGFSPRKQNISLYLMAGIEGNEDLLLNLGKHKAGKGCLYLKQLNDVNLDVLKELIERTVNNLKKMYP
jgi:hypothetical protein